MHNDVTYPVHTRRRTDVVLMLGQRLRRRPNIKSTMDSYCVRWVEPVVNITEGHFCGAAITWPLCHCTFLIMLSTDHWQQGAIF